MHGCSQGEDISILPSVSSLAYRSPICFFEGMMYIFKERANGANILDRLSGLFHSQNSYISSMQVIFMQFCIVGLLEVTLLTIINSNSGLVPIYVRCPPGPQGKYFQCKLLVHLLLE